MKTYKQIQEVMSMSDMNKVAGGTDHQRKVAQDRQRKREAKAKGFDPKKPVLDGEDSLKKSAPEVKSPTVPTKASPNSGQLKKSSSSAIVKSEPSTPAVRKPDLRKSQIGKWSQGIKSNPSAITKAQETKPANPEVEKVKVKVDEPKSPGGMENPQGVRPGTTKPTKDVGKGVVDTIKKKKKPGFVDGVKDELGLGKNLGNRLGKKLTRGVKSVPGKAKGLIKKGLATGKPTSAGTHTSGDLEGLSGRDKGLLS